jgi:hypothetical protein
MKIARILAVAATAACLASLDTAAGAADYPDMLGSWSGTSEAVVLGHPRHYEDNPDEAVDARLASAEFTLTLTGQDGRRLWGTFESPTHSEAWLGVLWSDGKGLRGVDMDGHVEGRILDENTMEFCYTHTGETMVASCVVLRRE